MTLGTICYLSFTSAAIVRTNGMVATYNPCSRCEGPESSPFQTGPGFLFAHLPTICLASRSFSVHQYSMISMLGRWR